MVRVRAGADTGARETVGEWKMNESSRDHGVLTVNGSDDGNDGDSGDDDDVRERGRGLGWGTVT